MSASDIGPAADNSPLLATALDDETLFHILNSPRRRDTIRVLDDVGAIEKGDLPTHVAACESDADLDDIGHKHRKRVYISLYQVHLEKLEDAGIIERDGDTIIPTREVTALAVLMRAIDGVRGESG